MRSAAIVSSLDHRRRAGWRRADAHRGRRRRTAQAPAEREPLTPGPGAPRRRRPRSVQDARDPRRHPHRRHRRAPGRPGRHRRRRQPHPGDAQRRHARPAAAQPDRAPQNADLEVDATGMYVLPGFVSLHEHAGGAPKNPDAEYPYKLWLAHGVTTVRGVPLTDHALTVSERERSNRNEIVAPAARQLSAPRRGLGQGAGRHAGSGARVGALGRRQRYRGPQARRAAARDHGGAARRGEEAQPRLDRAPAADRRRADERARPPPSSACRRSPTSTVTSKRC